MEAKPLKADSNFAFMQRSETWLSAMFLVTLVVMIIPLPTFLLDMFLACNLAAAIMLLLVTLGAKQPLDVSVFPSMLLLLTLFRLSLNVATTRLILLNADAGKIVSTFGDFVVGGNLIVGVVLFLILVTIQFIVITKGATRISEVNARFTLDAMPGKQMAIDAELNSHVIDEKEAKSRRLKLTREAEFYGAMDGASKYVRGDAIAGLVIMIVNIVGGVMLGVTNGQSVIDALQVYSLLTIGDGLVTQIPALVIATSAGILVTKSSSDTTLGDEIGNQFSRGHRSLAIGAFIMLVVSFTPGFPMFTFWFIGAGLLIFVNRAKKSIKLLADKEDADAKEAVADEAEENEPSPEEKNLEEFLQTDRVIIEIGAGLIPIVEPKKGNGIAKRIANMRADMAQQNGFWIPQARIKDNLQIGVADYRFLVCGRLVGQGSLMLDQLMAINPGNLNAQIDGTPTVDPAFGMSAVWINESNKRRAEMQGFTVVDPSTVLVTHLGECLRQHAHELLSRQDMHKMLEKLKKTAPTTVEEIKPDTVRPGLLHQALVQLLKESVPITSLEKIVESAVHHGPQNKTTIELTESIRNSIGHLICDPFRGDDGRIRVIILEPNLEHHFRQITNNNTITMAPASLERFVGLLQSKTDTARIKNEPAAILVDSSIRFPLRQTILRSLPSISVLAYSEIPNDLVINAIELVRFDDVIHKDDGTAGFEIQLPDSEPPTGSNQ